MARPAGLSSDEDDEYDLFDDEEPNRAPIIMQRTLNPTEEREQRLSSLFFNIMRGNSEDVRRLLDEGLDVNVKLRDNWNPIVLAASIGDVIIVQELINRGADVNSDRDKYTALMAASNCPVATAPYERSAEVARLLIENGANVNAVSRKRMTAFLYAASSGNVEIIRLLLPLCDKNAEDNQGWTALFWAVNDNHPEVVKILLDEGLNPEKVDVRTNTPLNYALSQDFEEIIKLLPSRKVNEQDNVFKNCAYNFENEFQNLNKNERPAFFQDVCIMLYGMKCEQLISIFVEKNVTLSTFVSLNEERLEKLGIIPYQRNKIMTGLHKFHKHPYKAKSIPIVQKNEIYSTIDISNSLMSAIRQLITMEGALAYINHEAKKSPYNKEIIRSLYTVHCQIRSLRRLANILKGKAQQWDEQTKLADLITKDSLKQRRLNKRWITVVGVIAVAFVITKRKFWLMKLF